MRIALGDLRHYTAGRHSIYMPLGIGTIASYLLSQVASKDLEVKLYENPDSILEDIDRWQPDVIGLSNYCWNTNLSHFVFKYAKEINPDIVCIAGGPNFPNEKEKCKEYLLTKPDCDFYILFEGEVTFSELIKKIMAGNPVFLLKSERLDGIASINPKSKELVIGNPAPRLLNLDEIPSPYLTGLMDNFFNGEYAPTIETARGCPFTCGFCYNGQSYYSPMMKFSIERIKEELIYITKRMKDYPNISLEMCDNNFGMTKRDEKIAEIIRNLQDEYGWPTHINVATGKANYDRILRIASHLRNTMPVTCSVQSLNPATLKVIKRKNLPMEKYKEVQNEIRKRGMPSVAEYIIPMPNESKASFFEGIKKLFNVGVKIIVPYTTMLLKGTYLYSQEARNNFKYTTKFRIIPRQFGKYLGNKVFEIEEVCVATNTLSFQDYLECRGFGFIAGLLSSEQFDLILLHLKNLKIDEFDYLYYVWDLVKSGKSGLSEFYNQFLEETKSELWDSEETLKEFYTKQENYNKLLSGELGDNLMRKFKTKIFLDYCQVAIDLFYEAIESFLDDVSLTPEIKGFLNDAKVWSITCRDIYSLLKAKDSYKESEILHLNYDINKWYHERKDCVPLISYKGKISYKISTNKKQIDDILTEGQKTYGEDVFFRIGKIVIDSGIKSFWRNCEPI
ncbi:MAG: B12-binding domain-containing radical SAM protein [Promethearchaeota archaeon]